MKDIALTRMICRRCQVSKPVDEYTIPLRRTFNPMLKDRRETARRLVANEMIRNQKHLIDRLRDLGFEMPRATMSQDMAAMQIMHIPCPDVGHPILGLPQGIFSCDACVEGERAKHVHPPRAKRPNRGSLSKPHIAQVPRNVEMRYCPICESERRVDTFEGKNYCNACAEPFRKHECILCNEARQSHEMLETECIYCVVKRHHVQDIEKLRLHMRKHQGLAIKVKDYVAKEFCKLLGLET